jgi:UDP-GlcNAc:undecaprenyl-phosphate GlcNAc-1-phosphate transferase
MYWPVLATAFVVSVIATPIVSVIARKTGLVDHPDEARKLHKKPIAYLGGMAILVAVFAGIIVSYSGIIHYPAVFRHVPIAILVGMFAITFTGLADDAWGWDPWYKTAGQLVAAAALSVAEVGVNVAGGFFNGVFGQSNIGFFIGGYYIDITYWVGTAIIAIFVLGACNSANLIDGLDGLLSGVVAITVCGLIAISVMVVVTMTPDQLGHIKTILPIDYFGTRGNGITLMGANIVIGLSVLGAVLGFLIFNFNPASIFLGDTGSLLLGYLCIAMILMLGEKAQTHLVLAGLIVFALPILDTLLAIIRRKIAGKPMSEPDSNHIHHIIKRHIGGVKTTVFALYGISSIFCLLGIALAWAHLTQAIRAWVIYIVAIIIFGGISLVALRAARRHETN